MDLEKHRILFINIGCIIAFLLIAIFIFNCWLSSYTSHDENVVVPDFSNLDYEAAQILAKEANLQLKINDTLCVEGIQLGAIVDHFPPAGSKVKQGRTIFLSLNSTTPLMITMPNVTDVSLRQATQILINHGLRVGALEYKPDFADNYVFEQRYHSQQILPGTQVPKGSAIDLCVGQGGNNVIVSIPNLTGLSWLVVKDSLMARGMNINPIFDKTVLTADDSIKSKVQRQSPLYVEGGKMTASEPIDIWLGISSTEETTEIIY